MPTQQVETQPKSEPPNDERARSFMYKSVPESAGIARREVGAILREWGFADIVDDMLVCLNESLTNALTYGNGPEITVIVTASGSAVRVEVEDHADEDSEPAIEVPPEAGTAVTTPALAAVAERGRGLFLVDALSTRWGVRPRGDHAKGVWFELDTPTPAATS